MSYLQIRTNYIIRNSKFEELTLDTLEAKFLHLMPCFKPLRYVGHLVGMARILLLNWVMGTFNIDTSWNLSVLWNRCISEDLLHS